jgi:hypothetical protein
VTEAKFVHYFVVHLIESENEKPTFSVSKNSLHKGEVIRLSDGIFYCVIAVSHVCDLYNEPGVQSGGQPTIFVSLGAQTPLNAMKAAIEHKHLPDTFWPFLSSSNE